MRYNSRMKEVDYEPEIAAVPSGPVKHWGEKAIPLRTYADDVTEAMKTGDITKTRVIIAEQERRTKNTEEPDETHRHLLFGILIATVLFALLAGIIAVIFFGVGRSKPIADPTGTIPVAVDSQVQVDRPLSKASLDISEGIRAQVIADLRIMSRANMREKEVVPVAINNNGHPGNTDSFFSSIASSPTSIDSIDANLSLALVRSSTTVAGIVLYGLPYENLLVWAVRDERLLAKELIQILDPFDQSSVPQPYAMAFRDGYVSGTDVRVLKREDGTVRFVWGIVDRTYLIITANDMALSVIADAIREGVYSP